MDIFLPNSIEGYRRFLEVKQLPRYKFTGRTAWLPDEYAGQLGLKPETQRQRKYTPPDWMFDYQQGISNIAMRKQKYCLFMDCGLGKTPIMLEHANVASKETGKPSLIVSPLMVIPQTISEAAKFYGPKYKIEPRDLQTWMRKGTGIGITNYEAIRDELDASNLGCISLDESSMLKSHY